MNPGYFFPTTMLATYAEETAHEARPSAVAPCVLPSSASACDVVAGVPGAIPRAALHTAGRAVLIAAGVWVAGERDWGKLAKYGVGGALAVEVFALSWAWTHRAPAAPITPTGPTR